MSHRSRARSPQGVDARQYLCKRGFQRAASSVSKHAAASCHRSCAAMPARQPPATDGPSHTQCRRGVLAIPERTREGKMGWPHCTFSCEGLVCCADIGLAMPTQLTGHTWYATRPPVGPAALCQAGA